MARMRYHRERGPNDLKRCEPCRRRRSRHARHREAGRRGARGDDVRPYRRGLLPGAVRLLPGRLSGAQRLATGRRLAFSAPAGLAHPASLLGGARVQPGDLLARGACFACGTTDRPIDSGVRPGRPGRVHRADSERRVLVDRRGGGALSPLSAPPVRPAAAGCRGAAHGRDPPRRRLGPDGGRGDAGGGRQLAHSASRPRLRGRSGGRWNRRRVGQGPSPALASARRRGRHTGPDSGRRQGTGVDGEPLLLGGSGRRPRHDDAPGRGRHRETRPSCTASDHPTRSRSR